MSIEVTTYVCMFFVAPKNVNTSPAISPPVFLSPELSPQHNQQQQFGRSLKSSTISQKAQSPKKASRVEGEVMDEFLQKVADNIGRDWSRLGVRPGIEFRTLEQIRHSVPYDTPARQPDWATDNFLPSGNSPVIDQSIKVCANIMQNYAIACIIFPRQVWVG